MHLSTKSCRKLFLYKILFNLSISWWNLIKWEKRLKHQSNDLIKPILYVLNLKLFGINPTEGLFAIDVSCKFLVFTKNVAFIDLPLTMTIEWDLSALNSRSAQVRAVMHQESKVWDQKTLVGIRLRSFMKACNKGNVVLLVVNLGTLACIEYSSTMFILAKKMIYWKPLSSMFEYAWSTMKRNHIYVEEKQTICGEGTLPCPTI